MTPGLYLVNSYLAGGFDATLQYVLGIEMTQTAVDRRRSCVRIHVSILLESFCYRFLFSCAVTVGIA